MPHFVPQPVHDEIKSAILALNNAHAVELSWLNARQLEALLLADEVTKEPKSRHPNASKQFELTIGCR